MNFLKTSTWIIFAFGLASVPIFYLIIKSVFDINNFWKIFQENVSHGELVYISLPLYWISAGDLFSSSITRLRINEDERNYSDGKIIVCFCIAGVSLIFAHASTFLLCDYEHNSINLSTGAFLSISFYIASFIFGFTSARLHLIED